MVIELLDGLAPFVEACAAAARALGEEPLKEQLQRIEAAAREVGRSWSGSSLGYHGNVFYKDLQKPPPGAVFSVEWGLMDQGFSFHDGTVGEWEEFDPVDVRVEILRRAGAADPNNVLRTVDDRCKAAFSDLRHEALSVIDALFSNQADATLAELRGLIAALEEVDTNTVNRRLGTGPATVMSRDMRAVSSGTHITPAHLVLLAQIDLARAYTDACSKLVQLVRWLDSYLRKRELMGGSAAISQGRDPRSVFVIYGRNTRASSEIEKFLLAIGLHPLTFDEARRRAGSHPSVLDIVKFRVANAQVVIVLFTPDEWAALDPALRLMSDRDFEKCRWQARQNVPFEAGLAMGLNPAGTILATLGSVELPSDITGLHQFRLSNDVDRRYELRVLLKTLGCPVDESGSHFLDPKKSGDFDALAPPAVKDPFGT